MFINKKIFINAVCILLSLSFHSTGYCQTTATLIPKKGLHVSTNGLPWLSGSEINFFTLDKKQHHYYFTWWEQDAYKSESGHENLLLGSNNTAMNGVYSLEKTDTGFNTFFDCKWNLKESGIAEIVYGKIWLPYFSDAVFSSPSQTNITDWSKFHDKKLQVKTNFGTFEFYSTIPFKVKIDANLQPTEKDFSRSSQYLILYEENITVTDSQILSRAFAVKELKNTIAGLRETKDIKVVPEKISSAWYPDEKQNLLLPQPKSISWYDGEYKIYKSTISKVEDVVKKFRNLLSVRWQIGREYFPIIKTTINKALPEEGYSIEVSKSGVYIQYQSKAGLQHALHTLVQLVKNKKGQLIIPFVKIKDWPSVSWRGIHMFTGPTSWPLHKQMYDRVIFPLKMNKVVLQCEQAQWESRPELHNSISVPMQDLKAEFDYLRQNNNEPIPLIQSLGHMEWFFKPKQNRWLAVNPAYPYTLNPNLAKAKEAIKQLWDETFKLLQPKVMHVGFDEIGMIGFNQPKEKEVDYFKTQIDFLNQYAKNKKAKLMIWGDMGLGPNEGPDALNGVSQERAATIRSFIPKGSFVADWHYLNNPNPALYKTNLRIWKQNGNIPLASPWLWPNNVRGFIQAAIEENAGVLQTTWADFESSEKNMLQNIEQFGAYILAMEYAWSGRKDLPAQLPYHSTEEWIKRFYTQPKPILTGSVYKLPCNFQLKDITLTSGSILPDSVALLTDDITTKGISLKASTANILPEGTTVAEMLFLKRNKTIYKKDLRYGVDVRTIEDRRMIYACNGENTKLMIDFFEKTIQFDKIIIVNIHPASGLKVDELILIGK